MSLSRNKLSVCFFFLFLLLVLVGGRILSTPKAEAQMNQQQISDQEAQWQAELQQTEADIAKWQAILDQTKQGTASLQNDAAALQAKINAAKAFIKQRQIQIAQLTSQIGVKTQTINQLTDKINRGKESLASIIRSSNLIDEYSLPEVILSNSNISDFFKNLDTYNSINASLENQFKEIRSDQAVAEAEKKVLDAQRTDQADKSAEAEAQKKKVEIDEAEKQRLITINKTNEQTYSQVIADKQKRAAQIRAALFSLRDTQGIAFGDALKFATEAGNKTGVRPAFILAILTQESDLGKNQGSCLVTSLETGDGVGKNTGTLFEKVMKSPRDTVPFQDITNRLNRDWKITPVSCPLGYKYVSGRGYGGAMGPSQFIASTWELFKDRIGQDVGVSADQADPWNPEHAITATAIYLSDLGANSGGFTAEIRSACKYYGSGGSSCSYGKQVMDKAQNIQLTMIDPLQGF